MSNTVQVIDNISGQILFETSIERLSEAYEFASFMEKEGLDIDIHTPGLTETLISSLGASDQEMAEYKMELEEELESHEADFGCAICLPKKSD